MMHGPSHTRSITTAPCHSHVSFSSHPSATVSPYDRFTCLVLSNSMWSSFWGKCVLEKIAFISFFFLLLYTTI